MYKIRRNEKILYSNESMIPLYAKMERIVKAATKKRYAVEKLSD
jgi:hypothetical protein